MSKLQEAYRLFDDYNRKDPNVFIWDGNSYPRELFFAIKLHEWVLKLSPQAGEALLLASRCQHIGRWEIPRDSYPEGRDSYLKWRRDLAAFHAEKATEILEQVGYDEETISRVRRVVLKQKIKVDPEVQTIENALCLVFLEFQYEEFYTRYPAEKVVNILKKSLLKMDGHGHKFALALSFSEKGLSHIREALKLIAEK